MLFLLNTINISTTIILEKGRRRIVTVGACEQRVITHIVLDAFNVPETHHIKF